MTLHDVLQTNSNYTKICLYFTFKCLFIYQRSYSDIIDFVSNLVPDHLRINTCTSFCYTRQRVYVHKVIFHSVIHCPSHTKEAGFVTFLDHTNKLWCLCFLLKYHSLSLVAPADSSVPDTSTKYVHSPSTLAYLLHICIKEFSTTLSEIFS